MSWADYKPPVTMIATGEADGKERPVRGLSLEDMTALVVDHLDDMMEITTLYIQSQKDVRAVTNYTEMIILVSKSFPHFVSEVISIVTDTPELRKVRLGAALQLKILSASLKLTVEDFGGVGNLSALLQGVVKDVLQMRGEAGQKLKAILSPSSYGESEKTPIS